MVKGKAVSQGGLLLSDTETRSTNNQMAVSI